MPEPDIGPTDVLIRVKRAGICGTDLHIYRWDSWSQRRITPPRILGHEFMGEVVQIGELVDNVVAGDRVSAESHVVCGHCELCRTGNAHVCRNTSIIGVDRDGAFAELVAVPAGNLVPLPDAVSDDQAAIFDPWGNAFHTVLHNDVTGRKVVIIGCGPIGLFAVGIARAAGAMPMISAERNPATAHLFIINPLSGERMDNLFSTHPGTENRIAALQGMAGEMTGGTPELEPQADDAPAGPWSDRKQQAPPRPRGSSGGPWD